MGVEAKDLFSLADRSETRGNRLKIINRRITVKKYWMSRIAVKEETLTAF